MTLMSELLDLSRRRILKLLSSAPLLPLAADSSASVLLWACGGTSFTAPTITLGATVFSPMVAPGMSNPTAMAITKVASSMSTSFSDGSKQNFKLAYGTFFNTGNQVPSGKRGKILSGGYCREAALNQMSI
jgi:hypothetical protein